MSGNCSDMSLRRYLKPESPPALPERTQVLDLHSERSDEIFDALAADTARQMLAELFEEPQTASELADSLDQSIQNIKYHTEKLQDAELIEVSETRYSDSGTEMKVYIPTENSVLLLSTKPKRVRIKELLSQYLATVILLGAAAVVFRTAYLGLIAAGQPTEPLDDPGIEPSEDIHDLVAALPLLLDPAVTFFLGGLVALGLVYVLVWIRRAP